MLTRLLDALGVRKPARIEAGAALRPGRAVLFGTLQCETPVKSPIYGKPCAAFYYRASFRRASRVKGFAQALLRDALVYADGLTLVLADGATVTLAPRSNTDFGRPDHQALQQKGIDGFRAIEKRIPVRSRVAAHGVLRRASGGWQLQLDQLDRDEGASEG